MKLTGTAPDDQFRQQCSAYTAWAGPSSSHTHGPRAKVKKCTWGNDPTNKQHGENIYAGAGGPWNVTEPADLWYNEVG